MSEPDESRESPPEPAEDGPDVRSTGVAERCGCGIDWRSKWSEPEPRYGALDFLGVIWGMSRPPRSIDYRCWKCKKIIARTTDPKLLNQET